LYLYGKRTSKRGLIIYPVVTGFYAASIVTARVHVTLVVDDVIRIPRWYPWWYETPVCIWLYYIGVVV